MDLDSKERRIAVVHVMHGKGLVWDADGECKPVKLRFDIFLDLYLIILEIFHVVDAYWLREKHRIVGSMVGGVSGECCYEQYLFGIHSSRGGQLSPRCRYIRYTIFKFNLAFDAAFKQQNLVHGLPLQLCPEEVTVLKELGLTKLETFKLGERNAEHLKSVSHLASNQNDAHASTSNSDSDEESTASEETKQWQRALAEGSEFLVPVHKADNLSGEETAWPFPRTDEERCRYLVFRDLHKRGFSITAGSKFGADFLLYPGDPTQFHAQ